MFEGASVVEEPPEEDSIREFWERTIWGDADKYNKEAEWIDEVKKNHRKLSLHGGNKK